MSRWVSYILLLSILRLQLVFCGCGAVGYMDVPEHPFETQSGCESRCDCGSHVAPSSECKPTNDASNREASQELIDRISPLCKCYLNCENHEPAQSHSHQIFPKTSSTQRFDPQALGTLNAMRTVLSADAFDTRLSIQSRVHCGAASLVFLTLVAQLRV